MTTASRPTLTLGAEGDVNFSGCFVARGLLRRRLLDGLLAVTTNVNDASLRGNGDVSANVDVNENLLRPRTYHVRRVARSLASGHEYAPWTR